MKYLVTLALLLVASVAHADHGKRYVDPSHGSSWKWRPNPPIYVPYLPTPGAVRVTTMPDGFTPASRAALRGEVKTYVPYYGGDYGFSPVILVNPYCR